MRDATIELPNAAKLLADADLVLEPGHSVRRSPAAPARGKSTLFRAIAGIWPFGTGRVQRAGSSAACSCRSGPICRSARCGTRRYPRDRQTSRRSEIARGAGRCRASPASLRGWTTTRPGRSASPAASSSAWRWRGTAGQAGLAVPGRGDRQPRSRGRGRTLSHAEGSGCRTTTLVSIAHRPSVAAFHDRRVVFQREEGKTGELVRTELAAAAGGNGDG